MAPNVLEAMANTGTDKGPSHHQYQRYYDKWLAPFQFKQGLKLVEIGAERGRSLHMWSKYFQNASLIAGLAYGDMTEHVEESSQAWDKVAVYWGDQSKQETMQLLADKGPWDVVIDDGSHYPAHQIFSFFSLWNSVNPGGLYVVEDLETNYWAADKKVYGYTLQGRGISNGPDQSAVAKFKQFIDILMGNDIGAPDLSIMSGDRQICSIEWGMNLVAFKKCSAAEMASSPKVQPRRFDQAILTEWVQQATTTNPIATA